jgi:uncharacterized protein (TIGR02266 family)
LSAQVSLRVAFERPIHLRLPVDEIRREIPQATVDRPASRLTPTRRSEATLANTPDNRKTKRSPVTLRIKFKSANLEQFIERYAVDVSQGGIFIRTKEPLPVGTTMRFEFQLRDESPLITGEGTVVWIREQNASQAGVAPGMGVRFDRLTESSQSVLDEILAYKASRGANGVATPVGEMPTRVVSATPRKDGSSAPIAFAGEGVPEEAFEQATKVHSLEELAELSARPDNHNPNKNPGQRNTGGAASTERYPAGFDPVTDFPEHDDDKTKVYPALARPGGRMAGPNFDLGASGTTQRLPPAPGNAGADVELGRAGYDEEDGDAELPWDTRDVELGLAGPSDEPEPARTTRSDEVELGHAGVTMPLEALRPAARPAGAPARGQVPARVIPLGDLDDLGESGASDPMSDVPLPEAGHFDLGQAGPTMQLRAERLDRGADVELGAAGSNEEREVITAALPAIPSKDKAQRPVQPAAVASAAAAARAPMHPDPEASEETQERPSASVAAAAAASDELAARRAGRRDSDLPADDDDALGDDDLAETDDLAAAAPQALADERAARSGPVLRVSTRTGTERVPAKKSSSVGLLLAAVAILLLVSAGALYMFRPDLFPIGPQTAEVPTPPATDPTAAPGTNPPPPVPDQPSTNPDTVAAAAAPDAAPAAAVEAPEPEIEIEIEPDEPEQPAAPAAPVETVRLEVRSVPPGATASLIDGDQSGPTPMKFALDKSKKHRVRVSHPGFASQEIELDPARPQPARVTLAPVPWVLKFESTPPKAFVYVDGRRVVGETPNEFQLPADWTKKKHFKVSFRLPHHQKLDIVVDRAFAAEGEAMVQIVRGALVPGEPAPHRPAPAQGGAKPTPPPTPPPGGAGEGGAAEPPPTPPAEPPKADPPPAAPEAPSADPAPQHP